MVFFLRGFSIEALRVAVQEYGVLAPFVLGVIEEIFFFIPSPLMFLAMGIVLIPAGVGAGPAFALSFGQIAFPAAFGVVLGAGFMYALAYFGGKPAIIAFGRYFGVKWGDVERIGRFFGAGYADHAVLVALRAIPIFPISVVSIFCGLVHIRPVAFFATTLIGSFIRIGTLSFVGWYAGKEYALLAGNIAALERVGVVVIVLLVVFSYFYLRSRSKGQNPSLK